MSQLSGSTALDSAYFDSGSSVLTEGANSSLDQEAFLTLLITQFQYQDPLNPMEDKEFIAQLAQFTALEQSMETNEKIGDLITSTDYQTSISVTSYIGKEVSARGYGISKEGSNISTIQYAASESVTSLTVNIFDANNQIVASYDLGAKSSGIQDFIWDGKTATGSEAADGVYAASFSGKNADGDTVMIDASVSGRVTGTSFYNGEYFLRMSDGRSITLANIYEVVEAQVQVDGKMITGTNGSDYIPGTEAEDDIISAGDGDDIIVYDPNDESVDGGSGFDFLIADEEIGTNATGYEAVIRGKDAMNIKSVDDLKSKGLSFSNGKVDISDPTWLENWNDEGDGQWSYKGEELISIEILEGYSVNVAAESVTPETETIAQTANSPVADIPVADPVADVVNNTAQNVVSGDSFNTALNESLNNAVDNTTNSLTNNAQNSIQRMMTAITN